jgi:hypothetical protein
MHHSAILKSEQCNTRKLTTKIQQICIYFLFHVLIYHVKMTKNTHEILSYTLNKNNI